jgi:hypothetical protein
MRRAAPSGLSLGHSPRLTAIDDRHQGTVAEVLDHLPPAAVEHDHLALLNGAHGTAGSKRAGRSATDAVAFTDGEIDPLVLAVGPGVKPGMAASRAERQAATAEMLRRCPELSDRWVGDLCGLSHSTVAKIRGELDQPEASARIGRDRRVRPVDPASARARTERAIADMPNASRREIAAAAGVAVATAQRTATALALARKAAPRPRPNPSDIAQTAAVVGDIPTRCHPGVDGLWAWLTRTDVNIGDLDDYGQQIPSELVHELADEFRHRARAWEDMARTLEDEASSRLDGISERQRPMLQPPQTRRSRNALLAPSPSGAALRPGRHLDAIV